MMKKSPQKSVYYLMILFSSWILILPAYLSYAALGDLDIVPFYTCIENMDQGDSIPSAEKEEATLASALRIRHILIAHLPLVRVLNLSYPLPSFTSESPVLRC